MHGLQDDICPVQSDLLSQWAIKESTSEQLISTGVK